MTETVALVVAAGRGTRMSGDVPKQYRLLAGRSVLRRTLEAFVAHPGVSRVCPVIHPDDADAFAAIAEDLDIETPVHGGATRQDSVRLGLEQLAGTSEPDNVLIHDGARAFVTDDLVDRVISALGTADGAVPAIDVHDTLKRTDGTTVLETVERAGLVRVQTPQGFRFSNILAAHRDASGQALTDDAAVAEAFGLSVVTVAGAEENIKITREDDLLRANFWLEAARETRMGSGLDVHRFADGDSVRLGGIDIAHNQSLAGHSDADVALHALTDALLGAFGDGDIGSHFPPSDARWQGTDSAAFLVHAHDLLRARGGVFVHGDLTIICEAPRIGPHRDAMRTRIANILGVEAHRISVKATTTEGLGFTGRNEGIAAQASVTITMEPS